MRRLLSRPEEEAAAARVSHSKNVVRPVLGKPSTTNSLVDRTPIQQRGNGDLKEQRRLGVCETFTLSCENRPTGKKATASPRYIIIPSCRTLIRPAGGEGSHYLSLGAALYALACAVQ